MEKARLETFTYDGWEHDTIKDHGASSKEVSLSKPSLSQTIDIFL
jgi:hypothetical protein